MAAKMICVTGPDGAGKTTQIQRLAERLERRQKKKVAVVTIWDPLVDPATQPAVPFKSPAEVDRYLGVLEPLARTLFLFHCLREALALAEKKGPDLVLANAYWYKYYATEVAHGGDERKTLSLADLLFPEPEITFFLWVDPDRAAARKAVLSGYETGFATPRTKDAFLDFQRRSGANLKELADQRGWIRLDGHEPPEALSDRIGERIARE